MGLIQSDENILLAYRNIKANTGSNTKGVDGKTIKDYKILTDTQVINIVRENLNDYKPDAVRRIYIDKENGKKRPLGIPTFKDRLIQQCILQVIEPHCEAKFHERSHAFRPFRSPETAIAQTYLILNKQKLHYAVSIDIKAFFDNVSHKRLMQQLWNIGIRDKKLLKIIKLMLKADIHEDGNIIKSSKGTPQGGILSPILSNIVLNDLDNWLSSQWESFQTTRQQYKISTNLNGSKSQSSKFRGLRGSTNLKEFIFVRYADDFIIFTNTQQNANKLRYATEDWIEQRLTLEVNKDKTKVVNLKKSSIEFLGFQIKVIKKRNKYVVNSRVPKDKLRSIHKKLKLQLKRIQHSENFKVEINRYNSIVMGIHNYYNKATMISHDLAKIQYDINGAFKNRIKEYKKQGKISSPLIKEKYGRSQQVRYVGSLYILPIGFVKHKNPMHKPFKLNKYTKEGRKFLEQKGTVNPLTLKILQEQRVDNYTIEYKDNRISKFISQKGKCYVTNRELFATELHCHHIKPLVLGGNDDFKNLVIIDKDIHKAVHATSSELYNSLIKNLKLTDKQITKVNELRTKASTTLVE